MHMGVGLDGHELVDAHAAGLADPAEVVALEIDEHDVLGALLGVRRPARHLRRVSPGRGCAAGCRQWGASRLRRPLTRTSRSGEELRMLTPVPLRQRRERGRIARRAAARTAAPDPAPGRALRTPRRRSVARARAATGWPGRCRRRGCTPWRAAPARCTAPGPLRAPGRPDRSAPRAVGRPPARLGRPAAGRRHQLIEQALRAGLGNAADRVARPSIVHQRARGTQGEGASTGSGVARQPQLRLDLRGHLVAEEHHPAAAQRARRCGGPGKGRRLRRRQERRSAPPAFQGLQKHSRQPAACRCRDAALRAAPQGPPAAGRPGCVTLPKGPAAALSSSTG